MAPRPKTLEELVAGRTFLARRHADRLLEAPLERADLRALQESYAITDDGVRQAIARAFEQAVREGPPDTRAETAQAELEAILNAPPEPWEPEKDAQASARFARVRYARNLFHDGLTVAEISRRLCASPYYGNASPTTVRRYLDELEQAVNKRPAPAALHQLIECR